MSKCTLIQGDCLEEMDKLIRGGQKVDLVLTDPPYGTTACKWDSIIPFDEMWDCLKELTYPTTPIVLFGSEPFSSHLRLSNLRNYKYDWVWYKNNGTNFAMAQKQPMRYHENISVFYKKQCTYNPQFQDYSAKTKKKFKQGEKVNISKELDNPTDKIHGGLVLKNRKPFDYNKGKYPESVQYFEVVPHGNGVKNRFHPTQKPIELLEYLIKTYTNPNDVVLDFTMGSGSTGVACLQTNRNFIGIELDENYYNIAKKRCSEYQSKLW